MNRRIICLVIAFLLLMAPVLPAAHADTVENNLITVTLTSPQTTYTADDSIPVDLKVENNSGYPIANVKLQILSVDGYFLSPDSIPEFTQQILFHGQEISTSAVHVLESTLPSTGDNTPIWFYCLLVFVSIGCFILLSMTNAAGRRAMCIILCFVCLGTVLFPVIDAQADEGSSLNTSNWLTPKRKVFRRAVVDNTQTIDVTHNVFVDKERITLRAHVTYDLTSDFDNLTDGWVDFGDLEMLETQGKIDVLYDTNGFPAFISGPFTGEKVTNCQEAADVLNSAGSLFGYDFYAEAEDIEQQQFTDIFGTTENFFRYTPSINGIKVFGSQIVLAAAEDGSITSLTNSYDNSINYVDTTPELTPDEAEAKAKEAFLTEPSVQALLNWMKQNDSTATDASVQADFLSWMQTESELLIYSTSVDRDTALTYAVKIRTVQTNGETINFADFVDNEVILPNYVKTYYVYANGSNCGQIHSVIDGLMTWSSKKISHEDNLGVKRTIYVQEKDGVYRLHDAVRNIQTRKVNATIVEGSTGKYSDSARVTQIDWPGDYVKSSWFLGTRIDRKAVSLHANMQEIYQFYANVLNHKSFDGKNGAIIASMDYWFEYSKEVQDDIGKGWYNNVNACFDPDKQQFFFGAGRDFQDCLDVIAHEYTHGVMYHVNDLIYANTASGALHEAYADIMANLTENKTGSGRWKMGETVPEVLDFTKRDMSNPIFSHYNDYIEGGDKYNNASIINYAAYKMMSDRRTNSVSRDQWARIFYDSMYRLTDSADFSIMRGAVLCSAAKYGYVMGTAVHDAIKAAFDAVGVEEPKQLRIVLNWGSEPMDLDSHLIGPAGAKTNKRFHVYYETQGYYAEDGHYDPDSDYFDPEASWKYPSDVLVANLVYDDTTSWGPEITKIHTLIPGDYYFFVHDFTNGNEGVANSRALANSEALVTITLPNGTVRYFSVNPTSKGTIWDVCRIHVTNDGFITIHRMDVYGDETTCR